MAKFKKIGEKIYVFLISLKSQMIGGSDPNLVNPQNKQGYGRNVQTQLLPQPKTTPPSSKPTTPPVTDSMGEQTYQAALQLGVLVRQWFFENLKKWATFAGTGWLKVSPGLCGHEIMKAYSHEECWHLSKDKLAQN